MSQEPHRLEPAVVGTHEGLRALRQSFAFPRMQASVLADTLWSAPLIGAASVFGERPGVAADEEERRGLRGFSPAPGFVFDVAMRRAEGDRFVVRFSQPDRSTPYLEGEIVWHLYDGDDGAVLDEQINTAAALKLVDAPLTGSRPSLRRWLFFRVGHHAVMNGMVANLARLAASGRS